jgi:NitT/TauT family transport system ATP-binding protein
MSPEIISIKEEKGSGVLPNANNNSMDKKLDEAMLHIRDLYVSYENSRTGVLTEAVHGVDIDIYPGEFVSIVGLSGCGKSTFLSAVAGLIPYDSGTMRVGGVPVKGPGPDRAVVFQRASLLPWRTVLENTIYGLELRGVPIKEAKERGREILKLVQLTGFENYHPRALSGGMQQRTNLARALTSDPQLLLLDEPFGALDAITREIMQNELLDIWQKHRKTVLFVTHQIDEAVLLSDRIIVFTERPARVRSQVIVTLARPRSAKIKIDPEFAHLVDRVWSEVNRLGSETGEAEYAI